MYIMGCTGHFQGVNGAVRAPAPSVLAYNVGKLLSRGKSVNFLPVGKHFTKGAFAFLPVGNPVSRVPDFQLNDRPPPGPGRGEM